MKGIFLSGLAFLLIVVAVVVFVKWDGFNAAMENNANKENGWQFAVIGDTEDIKPITKTIVADLAKHDLAFVVHVGDISSHGDPEKLQEVKELFAMLPFPTYFVPGNNDLVYDEVTERKTSRIYQEVISESLSLSFDHRNAHMVLLDNSYRRIGFSDEQLKWLAEDLKKNSNPYTFLFFHRPIDVPFEDIIGDDETEDSREQNEKFKQLIAQFSITRIFTGHLHTSLTYPLQGIPLTVTGGGGALPQALLGGEDAAFFHYQLVTVQASSDPTIEIISF